jgi:hypothetical protein
VDGGKLGTSFILLSMHHFCLSHYRLCNEGRCNVVIFIASGAEEDFSGSNQSRYFYNKRLVGEGAINLVVFITSGSAAHRYFYNKRLRGTSSARPHGELCPLLSWFDTKSTKPKAPKALLAWSIWC